MIAMNNYNHAISINFTNFPGWNSIN